MCFGFDKRFSRHYIRSRRRRIAARIIFFNGIHYHNGSVWIDKEVIVFGKRFRTVGEPTQGIEANIPLDWNKKVKVVVYE